MSFDTTEPVFSCSGIVYMGSEYKSGEAKKSGKHYEFFVCKFFVPANYSIIEVTSSEDLDIPPRTTGTLFLDISRKGYNNVINLVSFRAD